MKVWGIIFSCLNLLLKKKRKGSLWGGPWHFDKALIVLTEPASIRDIKDQSFTHTTFWVQIHNIPIMCMNREAIQKLWERIGLVKEIEMNENGLCIGQFVRVRISINITKSLKKSCILAIR